MPYPVNDPFPYYRIAGPFFPLLVCIAFSGGLSGQIVKAEGRYPGVRSVKTKQFAGTGGWGYYNIQEMDARGRVAVKSSYRRGRLLSRRRFSYDGCDNQLYAVTLFDINDAGRAGDTSSVVRYSYGGDCLITAYTSAGTGHIETGELLHGRSRSDTLTYTKAYTHYDPAGNVRSTFTETIRVQYDAAGRRTYYSVVHADPHDGRQRRQTTAYTYNANGDVARVVDRYARSRSAGGSDFAPIPPSEFSYVGGPGGDDVRYEYKYNKAGWPVKRWVILGEKRILLYKRRYVMGE